VPCRQRWEVLQPLQPLPTSKHSLPVPSSLEHCTERSFPSSMPLKALAYCWDLPDLGWEGA
jgi:hypothetical protein